MLTKYTKDRLSRPYLSVVEKGKIDVKLNNSTLDKLVALKPGDLKFEDYDAPVGIDSDPVDPFAESNDFNQNMALAKKQLSKMEQNLQVMASFTDDFKKAMKETRKELELESRIRYENMDEVNNILKGAKSLDDLSKSFHDKLCEIFRDEEYLNCGPELDLLKTEKTEVGEKKEYDIMSGVWKMLATAEGLPITPPGYNAYLQKTPHWLDSPNVSCKILDKSIQKCNQWLDKKEKQ